MYAMMFHPLLVTTDSEVNGTRLAQTSVKEPFSHTRTTLQERVVAASHNTDLQKCNRRSLDDSKVESIVLRGMEHGE